MLPLARCRLLAIALFPLLAATAAAQTRVDRFQSRSTEQESKYPDSQSTTTPTINDYARRSYSPYDGYEQSCSTQRDAQMRRVAMMTQRREAEHARRVGARAFLPLPIMDDEKLAAGKFQLAHLLWQGGNTAAAQKWLDEILVQFPNTETADRARQTLARL
jgi:hypothetical protein